jgi:hypothetical protein
LGIASLNSVTYSALLQVMVGKRSKCMFQILELGLCRCETAAYLGRGEGVGSTPPTNFRSFDKAEPNSVFRGKYIRNNIIRIQVLHI